MGTLSAEFAVGQVICHKKFDYRGVIVDVDPLFSGTEAWYEQVARSRPPKDRPWYHVLVDGGSHRTYVAERHLQVDSTGAPIKHPQLSSYFDARRGSSYVCSRLLN